MSLKPSTAEAVWFSATGFVVGWLTAIIVWLFVDKPPSAILWVTAALWLLSKLSDGLLRRRKA